MTAIASVPSTDRQPSLTVGAARQAATFGAVLWRDMFVTTRELGSYLTQVFIMPLGMLLIFGKVLANLGYATDNFAAVLLPGVVAMNAFVIGLENTALPLVMDFSFSREIEDRLLSPMSMPLVALEKVLFGALRGLVAGLLMIPVGMLLLGVTWPWSALLPVTAVLLLGALVGAALGLVFGTLVPPHRIQIMFTVALTPLMFTGATQFPLRQIGDLRWLQVLCAANPMSYVSEATRAIVQPAGVVSVPLWTDVAVLSATLVVATAIGVRGFVRRAMD